MNTEETLATRLAKGPLPLDYALRCATRVASALRELHAAGRTHGNVEPAFIVLKSEGATLLPPNGHAKYTVSAADVSAFGALLYEMVTGNRPLDHVLPLLPPPARHAGASGLRIAATRLASRCFHAPQDGAASMQRVVTEVRLLSLMAQQAGGHPDPASISAEPAGDGILPAIPPDETPHTEEDSVFRSAEMISAAELPPSTATDESVSLTLLNLDVFLREPGIPEPQQSRIQCPKCTGLYVYPSKARTGFEETLVRWRMPVLRCHRCLFRYLQVGNWQFDKPSAV